MGCSGNEPPRDGDARTAVRVANVSPSTGASDLRPRPASCLVRRILRAHMDPTGSAGSRGGSRPFRVVAHRIGERSKREFVIDAGAPVAAALEAFSRLSSLSPDVVDVIPLHDAGSQSVTVTVEAGPGERFRLFVEPTGD